MNESFADLTMLEPFMDSNIYMPYYNTLTNNTVKGTVLVSTAGGGTANTEYEFLTRNSMAFFLEWYHTSSLLKDKQIHWQMI